MFFPLSEGSGLSFLDHAGGRVWTPSLLYDADPTAVHSVVNAVTLKAARVAEFSEITGPIVGDAIPAPGADKVALLISVYGPNPTAGSLDDYWYFRLGGTNGADPGDMIWNINSKTTGPDNAFKSGGGAVPETAPSINAMTKLATAHIACQTAIFTAPSTMVGKVQYDDTAYTGTDTDAQAMTNVQSSMQMQYTNTIDNQGTMSLYAVQYWLFDAVPSDLTTALLWTKENSLLGNKTPYPGWRYKT